MQILFELFDKIYNNELIYPDYTFNDIKQFWDNGKYKVIGVHIPTDKYNKGFQLNGIVRIKNKKCPKTINLSWYVCRSIGIKCIVSQEYFLLPAVGSSEQNKNMDDIPYKFRFKRTRKSIFFK